MTAPPASSLQALARMQRQRTVDTKPELALRRELWRRGRRYRVNLGVLPDSRRRQDIVFTRAKIVVDVRSCFFHRCPLHGTMPKANGDWWADKLAKNVARDADTERRLREAGWEVVVVWEHEDAAAAADRVDQLFAERGGQPRPALASGGSSGQTKTQRSGLAREIVTPGS